MFGLQCVARSVRLRRTKVARRYLPWGRWRPRVGLVQQTVQIVAAHDLTLFVMAEVTHTLPTPMHVLPVSGFRSNDIGQADRFVE